MPDCETCGGSGVDCSEDMGQCEDCGGSGESDD